MYICASYMYSGLRGQKRTADPLKLEVVSYMWVPGTEPWSGPLEEQTVLLPAKPPLQPSVLFLTGICEYMSTTKLK